jgi:putative sterol carrier protein
VARYLSDDWLAEMASAARQSGELARVASARRLTVQQVVTGGPDGVSSFFVRLADGEVQVERGIADDADVTFTQDHATAVEIGKGDLSAQAAFMSGRLRVGGDLTVLMGRQRDLAGVDDVFDAVRERTDFDS